MIRWLRDLINLFRRPIGRVPNYGNMPEHILMNKPFADGDAQQEIAHRIYEGQ